MTYVVTTYLDNKKINSEDIKIHNVAIYGILNKYIRAKENEQKKIEKNVS